MRWWQRGFAAVPVGPSDDACLCLLDAQLCFLRLAGFLLRSRLGSLLFKALDEAPQRLGRLLMLFLPLLCKSLSRDPHFRVGRVQMHLPLQPCKLSSSTG